MIDEGGVSFEDRQLVREFLGLSVRCGVLRGIERRASLLDMMKIRVLGTYTFPRYTYEITQVTQSGYPYVLVREQLLKLDGSSQPDAPGHIEYLYYYNEPLQRFELASQSANDPRFDPQLLKNLTDPLSFLASRWLPVCNGAMNVLWRTETESPARERAVPATESDGVEPPADQVPSDF